MDAGEMTINILFYGVAAIALCCGLAVATSRNIVRSAFSLLGVLFGVACIYLFAWADFLMGIQVLVYIGGILVLIIFAVMLTHRITDVHLSNESVHSPTALFAVLCLLFALGLVSFNGRWPGYERRKVELVASGATPGRLSRHGQAISPKQVLALPERERAQVRAEIQGTVTPKQRPMTQELGRALMREHLLPFEAISVLLLAALVGAAYLARKEVKA
jgi:NADH-quinone oxidoreductase subunit J